VTGTSGGVTASPPEIPDAPDPGPSSGESQAHDPIPSNPDPREQGSGAGGSAFPPPGFEVLELEEEENPIPNAAEDWRRPYIDYLLHDTLPDEKTEARRMARRAKSYVLIGGELYKRSNTGVLQRCIPVEQGRQLLIDIHSGACGQHAAPRALVGNAFRQGFYWLTAVADAEQIVRTCQGCQFYARQMHMPAQALQTIPITWPFVVWGLDMIGPLTKAPGATLTHLSP